MQEPEAMAGKATYKKSIPRVIDMMLQSWWFGRGLVKQVGRCSRKKNGTIMSRGGTSEFNLKPDSPNENRTTTDPDHARHKDGLGRTYDLFGTP